MTPAIFWDLQGTLGGKATADITTFQPYPFARDALRLAHAHGFLNIIITNQSRIGKGLLATEIYEHVRDNILAYFNADETLICDFLCCPHTSADHCNCKKPRTGLIDQCVRKYNINLSASAVIGDMGKNEIVMAHAAGCRGVLVLTGGGKASLHEFRHTWSAHQADLIADNALEAVKMLIK